MDNKIIYSSNLRFMSKVWKLIPFRTSFLIIFQYALIIISYIASYVIYFDGAIPALFYHIMLFSLPLILVVQGCNIYFTLRKYKGPIQDHQS